MKKISVAICLAFVLTGCVSTKNIPLDAAGVSAANVQSITLTNREKPSFSATTAGKAGFGLLGAAAMISAGNKIIQENNVEDPAGFIAGEVAKLLSVKMDVETVTQSDTLIESTKPADIAATYGDADLIVDVQTVNWSFVYFPTDWNNYRVIYSAKLRVVNAQTKELMAEGFCSRNPGKTDDAPSKDELLENSAARLKAELVIAATECVEQFKEMFWGLSGNVL